MALPIGILNLNPGNLKVSTLNSNLTGLVNSAQTGSFAQFDNMNNGLRGLSRDLMSKHKRLSATPNGSTITSIISEYAPSSDNPTASYIASVSSSMNLGANSLLQLDTNGNQMQSMMTGMIDVENGGMHGITQDNIKAGILSAGQLGEFDFKSPGINGASGFPIERPGSIITNTSSVDKFKGKTEPIVETRPSGARTYVKRRIINDIRPNVLHDFNTFTYNLTFAMMGKDDYSEFLKSPYNYNPTNIMVQSGGGSLLNRNKYFHDNFFIDDLNLETVTGMTMSSRATNATSLSFTVTEPYGVTLIERIHLASMAINEDPNNNYLQQPYLLIVDFKGWTDDGKEGNIENTKRFIPIKLTGITFTVNASGAVYSVEAIAYNELALTTLYGQLDVNLSITGKTVGEIITRGAVQKEAEKEGNREADKKRTSPVFVPTEYNGLVAALNIESEKKRTLKLYERPDEYEITMDDEILAATLIHDPKTKSAGGEASPTGTTAAKISRNESKSGTVTNNKNWNLPAGKNIYDIINDLIMSSDFITRQLQGPGPESNKETKPSSSSQSRAIQWYKIDTEVELLGFDRCRNDYARKFKYHVGTFEVNVNYTLNRNKVENIVIIKEYDYLFRGKNTDILDFNIQFDASYFETKDMAEKANYGGSSSLTDLANTKTAKVTEEEPFCKPPSNKPVTTATIPLKPGLSGNDDNTNQRQARSLQEAIFKGSKADLVAIDLEILGDPAFIQSHELFHPKKTDGVKKESKNIIYNEETGHISTRDMEIHLRLNLRTPSDYDETTGFMNFDKTFEGGSTISSMFNGIYKVLTVTHTLSGGQFKQTLNTIRVYDQQEDLVGEQKESVTAIEKRVTKPKANATVTPRTVTPPVIKPSNSPRFRDSKDLAAKDRLDRLDAERTLRPGVDYGLGITSPAQAVTSTVITRAVEAENEASALDPNVDFQVD